MKQPIFPSTMCTQSRFAYFLTIKAVVRKFGKSDGQTGSRCLDKAVLAQGGGGGSSHISSHTTRHTSSNSSGHIILPVVPHITGGMRGGNFPIPCSAPTMPLQPSNNLSVFRPPSAIFRTA